MLAMLGHPVNEEEATRVLESALDLLKFQCRAGAIAADRTRPAADAENRPAESRDNN